MCPTVGGALRPASPALSQGPGNVATTTTLRVGTAPARGSRVAAGLQRALFLLARVSIAPGAQSGSPSLRPAQGPGRAAGARGLLRLSRAGERAAEAGRGGAGPGLGGTPQPPPAPTPTRPVRRSPRMLPPVSTLSLLQLRAGVVPANFSNKREAREVARGVCLPRPGPTPTPTAGAQDPTRSSFWGCIGAVPAARRTGQEGGRRRWRRPDAGSPFMRSRAVGPGPRVPSHAPPPISGQGWTKRSPPPRAAGLG